MRDVLKPWVEALESDEYRRGTGALCNVKDDGSKYYCCLGVGAELVPDIVVGQGTSVSYGSVISYGEEHNTVTLPEEARKHYGLVLDNPYVMLPDGTQETLATLNDNSSYSYTLKQIAEVIRQQPDDWDGRYVERLEIDG